MVIQPSAFVFMLDFRMSDKNMPFTQGLHQERIQTGFHRFTKIGQIFHNKYIFNK